MPQPGSRTPLAIGLVWASRVTSLGLEFVLPLLAGVGLDHKLRTAPYLTLVGSALGFAVFFTHLLRIAREGTADPDEGPPPS